ncbi:MAG: META domain-containing protein [Desulfobacteraceae bacterium]|nr:META domain-containing protein [Desulfobacteraceae bacterium]
MKLWKIAFGLVAAGILAGCAAPAGSIPKIEERLVIRGRLSYPERIALPPASAAVVELRATDVRPAALVAEQHRQLDGRQVPIPFELSLDPALLQSGGRHLFRGAIVSSPGPLRVTQSVEIAVKSGVVALGELRLRPVERTVFGTPYRCGDVAVVFGALGTNDLLAVGGRSYDLKPVVSASGARYVALDDSDTSFWSKGDRATVVAHGVTLPECRVVTAPELPFTARGQEPGWQITIAAEAISLNADYGALQLRMPRPEPEVTAAGILYRTAADGRSLSVSIQPRICADIATGMPHPYRVRYDLDGETHSGCGGEPKSLLTGGEWVVEEIGGQPVIADAEVTILFMEEGRVAGGASCNRFFGSYKLSGEGLTFGQMGGTMMACPQPHADQEAHFLRLLQETYRFEIDPEGRLVLHTPGQERIVARRKN